MVSDVHFERGRLHAVCQDYGATGPGGMVVLSDGCSESPDSDIGSRLLCRAALNAANPIQSGPAIARQADNLRQALKMGDRCIDATLLVILRDGDGTVVGVWGDGAVLCRKRDGTLIAHEVSCKGHSAPPYLSYLVSPGRLLAYAQGGYGLMEVSRWGDPSADSTTVEKRTSQQIGEPTVFRLNGDLDAVMVFTDGYRTATDALGRAVDPADVLAEMGRVRTGAFPARRRFRMMVKDKGWTFGDDFGVGCITFP